MDEAGAMRIEYDLRRILVSVIKLLIWSDLSI